MYICFVGDFFVNGTGDPQYLDWTGRLCVAARSEGHDVTYYNLGIRRETSTKIKARWLAEVSCRLPKDSNSRIIFSYGVNDTTLENGTTRVSSDHSINNTRHSLHLAQQLFPVLMVGPPPIADVEQNLRTAALSSQFALICHELDVPYLDVFTSLQSSSVWMSEVTATDGAHPGAAGYSELAQLVKRWSCWQSWLEARSN